MRIDVLSIFPEYLRALDLSLVGKARREGRLDLRVHDLREWTTDRHRTVDDTPFGGGAGMVMRADVWGQALDELLAAGGDVTTELLVPAPAGQPFTQAMAQELAAARSHLVLACGRYEGIDARVAEHFRARGVPVREVSIGDYVLNGGEAAALVMIEAVARLLPGVVGNPESLVEESHGSAGLLEYPVYTKPASWRGHEVPDVLLSGDHGRIARWRRDQALARTLERRPDMLAAVDTAALDSADLALLARHGWVRHRGELMKVRTRPARPEDAEALARLAARTFPLACPPGLPAEDVTAFVAEHLSAERMREYSTSERHELLLAEPAPEGLVAADRSGAPSEPAAPAGAAPPVGYALLVLPATADEPPAAADVAAVVPRLPAAELSKCYVAEELHGSGLATALTEAALERAAEVRVGGAPLASVWLGTNSANVRAQRFYRKLGFVRAGRRTFTVGTDRQQDVVMVREVTAARTRPVSPP